MNNIELSEHLTSVLLRSENYRDFLSEALISLKASKKNFSLAILARKIGCKSKSYPREVITGRRTLSFDYADGFASAFGLKGETRKLFLKFVELERASEKDRIRSEIENIKTRLQNRIVYKKKTPQDVFDNGSWIDVYAALGTVERGATLTQICNRTKFSEDSTRIILDEMIKKGIVQGDSSKLYFKPVILHHFFEDLKESSFFQDRYLGLLDKIKRKAGASIDSEREHFQCSTISIKSSDMPKLKKELRELMNKFIQESESSEGDQLSHILVGLI
jgi:uncharacterized protein (TIGR02147 family)